MSRVDPSLPVPVARSLPRRRAEGRWPEDGNVGLRRALLRTDGARSLAPPAPGPAHQPHHGVGACLLPAWLGGGVRSSAICREKALPTRSPVPPQPVFPQLAGDGSHGSALPGGQVAAGRTARVRGLGEQRECVAGAAAPVSQGTFAWLVSLLRSQPVAPTYLGKGHLRVLSCPNQDFSHAFPQA